MQTRQSFFRSILLTLLAAVAACATPAGSRQHAEAPVRAMTFNIRYGTAPDGDNAWPVRRPLLLRAIRDFDPTLLGVQEALRFQLDEIATEIGHFAEIGVGRDDGRQAGEFSAILYDRRRLDVLDQGTFWLSDTPEVAGSMTWGNRYPRIVTWARFRDRSAHTSFYLFNTHWDHESQPARERSAALVLERIRQRTHANDPVLLMGDFNAGEDNAAFQALLARPPTTGLRLIDTFRALHPNARDVGTYHAFRGDRSGAKIDAILASPEWLVLNAGIVLMAEGGRFPSDHFPVTTILRRRPGSL
jgi:endonuclease/exonuclease/phosphatase family metal-dependent hydrolase